MTSHRKLTKPLTDEEQRQIKFRTETPKPDRHAKPPTAEEFAVWCELPVTRWVAARYEAQALACREAWTRESWDGGAANPEKLAELRVRADCYMAFMQTNWNRYATLASKD